MTHADKLLNAAVRRAESRFLIAGGVGPRRARRTAREHMRDHLQSLEGLAPSGHGTEAFP